MIWSGDLKDHEGSIEGGVLCRAALSPPPGLDRGEAGPRFRWTMRAPPEGCAFDRLLAP